MSERFSMIRGFHLADLFTLANSACGMGAVLAAMSYVQTRQAPLLLLAIALLPVAFACDALDGRVARWRRKSSLMGRELDSLADVISFAVAPATIAWAAGLRGGADAIALLFFVACAVSRLARFNVTAEALSAASGKVTHFEGLPTTGSLLPTLAIGALLVSGRVELVSRSALALGPLVLHPASLIYAAAGCLMISKTLRIPKP